MRDPVSVKPEDLRGISRGERVPFKTQSSARRWEEDAFDEDFVYVSREAARDLAAREVRTVGVETHRALLGAGIWVIEGPNLAGVEPGEYELVCLPLKIEDGDGAPARAIFLRAIRAGERRGP